MVNQLASQYMFSSPNNRRGPGGVGSELDSLTALKSVRGNWPLWSPMVSRGLPWPPVDNGMDNIYIYIYSSKVSNTALGPTL